MGPRTRLVSIPLAATVLAVAMSAATSGSPAGARAPARPAGGLTIPSDFDGDGFADLAVGSDGEQLDDDGVFGAVSVIYGTSQGLLHSGNQFWTVASPGVPGDQTFGFGRDALASGDFDEDGFADLAIGAPLEAAEGFINGGAVYVLYGSPEGLTSVGAQRWTQTSTGVDSSQEVGNFGTALVAGNFGKGTHPDLAIGAPGHDVAGRNAAGFVTVLYGSAEGLRSVGAQGIQQTTGAIEDGDFFGNALAAGHVGRSGNADLAIGVPFEDVGSTENAGAVSVYYGSSSGLQIEGAQGWTQPTAGLGEAQQGDHFGSALAIGNFGFGNEGDLAIGAPGETVGGQAGAGMVGVMFGSPDGVGPTGTQDWNQVNSGTGTPQAGDGFGGTLAAANFGSTSRADLAIGAPSEADTLGSVSVIYGTDTGLTATGAQSWDQEDFSNMPQSGERFGSALFAANLGLGRTADLAIGVPFDVRGSRGSAGSVGVLYGRSGGLGELDSQVWTQDSPGVRDQAETNDRFGRSLG